MNRTKRTGRLGGLAASAAAATPFAWLWVLQMNSARDPLTAQVRLDMAIWMAVFGTPWMIAAWLLWRAWWRQAGPACPGLTARGGCWRPRRRRCPPTGVTGARPWRPS